MIPSTPALTQGRPLIFYPYRIGGTAYDREHGLIYVIERFADGVKPVVHVFRVR